MLSSPSDIVYFVEVTKTLNLSRAAERLGIAQPSLSLAIQRIEKSLGAKILTRSKTGVNLTKAGEQLLFSAKDLLQSWENIKNKALASENKPHGIYSLGMHSSVALYSAGGFLPDLLRDNPNLNFKLIHNLSRKITEDIVSGRTDIGIVINPVEHPDLIIRKLCVDHVCLWGLNTNIANGISSDVLICDPNLMQTQYLIKQLKKNNLNFSRILTTSNLELIAELVLQGAGYGILPSRVANYINGKNVESLLQRVDDSPYYEDEICVVNRLETKNLAAIKIIKQSIINYFI